MSTSGVPVEEMARLAGHANSRTTEVVYRRETTSSADHRRRSHGHDLQTTITQVSAPRAYSRVLADRPAEKTTASCMM